MKLMSIKMFNNLIHDLGTIPHQLLKELHSYDNIRIIKLDRVDNKQPYNIILTEGVEDIDCKISYTYDYLDTDNITPYRKMISKHSKEIINSVYGKGGFHSNKINKDKLKAEMFKLEITKLMLKYNLSISHEDVEGAFIILPYNQYNAEWFNEAEYKNFNEL